MSRRVFISFISKPRKRSSGIPRIWFALSHKRSSPVDRRTVAARLAWATLRGSDPSPRACRTAISAAATIGADEPIYRELVGIAERKVRLEHNQFNLRLGTVWLKFHIALVLIMAVEIIFISPARSTSRASDAADILHRGMRGDCARHPHTRPPQEL